MSGCPLEETVERGKKRKKKEEKLWFCHLMSHGLGTASQG